MKKILTTKRALVLLAATAALAAVGITGALAATPKRTTVVPQQLTLYIFRGKESIPGATDGKGHDTMVPSTFGVKVGVPVNVTVINYDEGTHTITAPDLGLNVLVKAGTEFTTAPKGASATEVLNQVVPGITHFTFTVKKAGVYRWHCALPCDAGQAGWAMTSGADGPDQDGFMAGYIVGV